MVIDLGIDVTEHAWKKEGDVWTSSGPLLSREPIAAMSQSVVESVGEFATRRVRQAAAPLRSRHWPVARWQLVRASGLRKAIERLPEVQLALDYELSFHGIAPTETSNPAATA